MGVVDVFRFVLALGLAPPVADVPDPPATVPADYTLRWTAPDRCPTAETIRARVVATHGVLVSGEGVAEIEGTVTEDDDDGFALELTTRFAGVAHVRRMQSSACDELAEATAIVIVVALRSGLEVAMDDSQTPVPEVPAPVVPEDPPIDEVAPAIAPPPTPPPTPPPPPTRPRTPAPEPAIRVAGLGEIGALGVVTGGVQLTLALRWRRARAELYGLYLAPRLRRDEVADAEATFQAGIVGARGCWVAPLPAAFELPLCAGLEAGTVRIDAPFARTRRHTPWAAPMIGTSIGRPVGRRVRLSLGVDAAARVAGMRYRVEDRLVFGQWPVSLRWMFGIELRLGRA